jgi:hypothetical protein
VGHSPSRPHLNEITICSLKHDAKIERRISINLFNVPRERTYCRFEFVALKCCWRRIFWNFLALFFRYARLARFSRSWCKLRCESAFGESFSPDVSSSKLLLSSRGLRSRGVLSQRADLLNWFFEARFCNFYILNWLMLKL